MNKIKASVFFREISGPDIVLRSERGDIDLHAFMSFKELRYSVDRTLVLRWNTLHSQAVKVKDGFVTTVELVFVGVLKLGVRPRDPEMPFDTDQHLILCQSVFTSKLQQIFFLRRSQNPIGNGKSEVFLKLGHGLPLCLCSQFVIHSPAARRIEKLDSSFSQVAR